jgi:hypothetical protein
MLVDERIVAKNNAVPVVGQQVYLVTQALERAKDRCGDKIIPNLMPPNRAIPTQPLEDIWHLQSTNRLICLSPIIDGPQWRKVCVVTRRPNLL